VLLGPPGVGKTYFCSAIIEWIYNVVPSFRYWHEREFFSRLRSTIRDNSGEYSKEVEYMMDDFFVMYDDFGSCGVNQGNFREENILAMIDIRYESGKPTVITSNLNKKSITEIYGVRAASRIFDKCNLVIEMESMPDRRK
jgi:DNA replication protein DnaC